MYHNLSNNKSWIKSVCMRSLFWESESVQNPPYSNSQQGQASSEVG